MPAGRGLRGGRSASIDVWRAQAATPLFKIDMSYICFSFSKKHTYTKPVLAITLLLVDHRDKKI